MSDEVLHWLCKWTRLQAYHDRLEAQRAHHAAASRGPRWPAAAASEAKIAARLPAARLACAIAWSRALEAQRRRRSHP